MTTDSFTPPDMRLMLVAHHALCRDLERIRKVLAGPDQDADYRRGLYEHFGFWLWFLHHHHVAEDLGLWPALRERCPQASGLLDDMEADHVHLEELLADADQSIREWSVSGSPQLRLQAVGALARLHEGLSGHLAREESEVLPVVDQFLPEREWLRIDKKYFRHGVSLKRLSFLSPWFLDDVPADLASAWTDPLPAPILWMQRHRWQQAYTRRTEPLWRPLNAA